MGGIKTNNNGNGFPYGFYEINWKLPTSEGRWLSWWIWGGGQGQQCGNTKSEEIDLFENNGSPTTLGRQVDTYSITNLHMNPSVSCADYPTIISDLPPGQTTTSSYHKYGVEWTPKVVLIYFDDEIIKEIFYDYRVPLARKANMLITPGISRYTDPILQGAETKIDYVRVKRLKISAGNLSLTNQNDLINHPYSVKTQILVNGGSSSTLSVGSNSQQKITLRASDYILIENDFTVYPNSELTLFCHDVPNN